jgi:hypothetical protein
LSDSTVSSEAGNSNPEPLPLKPELDLQEFAKTYLAEHVTVEPSAMHAELYKHYQNRWIDLIRRESDQN